MGGKMDDDENLPVSKEEYHQTKREHEKSREACQNEHWEQKTSNQKYTEEDKEALNKTTMIDSGILQQHCLTILSAVCILSHGYQTIKSMKKFFIRIRIMRRKDVKYESKNKKKKKKKDNYNRYKTSRHHLTTYDKKAIYFLLIFVIIRPSNCKINVTLVNDVIIFGNDANLICTCNANMTNVNTWTKGQTKKQLTLGASSNDIEKYIPYLKDDNLHSYFLKIRNFKINDLDEYNCQCDFEGSSYTLSLDNRFVYRPREDEIISNVSHGSGFENLTFIMQTVYPGPLCEMTLQGYNVTTKFTSLLEKSSGLYMAVLTILLFPAEKINCTIVATVNCTLSTLLLYYNRNFTICHEKDDISSTDNNDNGHTTVIVLVVMGIFIVGAVLLIVACYSSKSRNKLKSICFDYEKVDQVQSCHIKSPSLPLLMESVNPKTIFGDA